MRLSGIPFWIANGHILICTATHQTAKFCITYEKYNDSMQRQA